MTKLIPELQKKLDEQKALYVEVQKFAEIVPMFKDEIIRHEYTSDRYCKFTERYKDMYFAWGICWSVHEPTNYEGEYNGTGTVSVYVNCLTLFHDDLYNFATTELFKTMQHVPMFHNDVLNSTFYFEPHQVEHGLDMIVSWYNRVKAEGDKILKQKTYEKLKRQLEELEKA